MNAERLKMPGSDRLNTQIARISGFVEAVRLQATYPSANANGSQDNGLFEMAKSVFLGLKEYAGSTGSSFPPALKNSFQMTRMEQITSQNSSTKGAVVGEMGILLHSLVTEVEYLLADNDVVLRTITERAFRHLQWSIAADPEIRAKWGKAFEAGEPAAEKLGGAHLLWHGIFPFKVSNRVATDLVLNETVTSEKVSVARGAVLTEWKRYRPGDGLESKIEAAEVQAGMYAEGVLGGAVLHTVRYIVVVSEKKATMPMDSVKGGITYRHVNISVDPDSPSTAAPRSIGRKKTA